MRLCYKLFLAREVKAFGEGPCRLLEQVEETGSLNKAAARMELSYTKAWHVLKRSEKELGFSLLVREVGGREGGGSALTPQGRDMVRRYRAFCQEAEEALNSLYQKHFGHLE